ncbi:MAG: hypothetical protein EOS20_24415 [Mesorhizobium sp.]|nr:MAG: hypothetical protein EOR96_02380 [Mesorhizobium sp.]RWQ33772.1 MAG: hypothetical protein EOS20_24415 [Mesorhizobium sp.]
MRQRQISPLEGEMSPKATEGGRFSWLDAIWGEEKAGASRAATPSGLPAISPSRREITRSPARTKKAARFPRRLSMNFSMKSLNSTWT